MPTIFEAGDPVEVRSAYSSVWYEALIVHAFAVLPRLYLVSYDNGVVNGAVTESVPADRVRPRPARSTADARFRLYQMVDAFSGGGWRVGVVFKVHVADGDWRYAVCFPEKREEMEFMSGDVRVHLDWVDGKWVSAEEKGITETLCSAGMLVEVAGVRRKPSVAWYPAIIIKVVDVNIFVVEYKTLRAEGDSSVTEIVASQYVRPYPPRTSCSEKFALLDEVEAFYCNGWWRGVIAKVNSGSKYNIKFLHCEEEIEFGRADLRFLYDWVDGQWVQASQDNSIKSQDFGRTTSVARMQLSRATSSPYNCKVPVPITPLSSNGDEALCKLPTFPPNVENGNSNMLTFQSKLESPCKKSKKGETIEDKRRLLDLLVIPRGTNISSGVNTELDVSIPGIEVESTFHIDALVEKCYSRSTSRKNNVVSQVTTTNPPSNNLVGGATDESFKPEKSNEKSSLSCLPVSIIGLVDKVQRLVQPGTTTFETSAILRAAEWKQNEGVSCLKVSGEQGNGLVSNHQPPTDEGVGCLDEGGRRRKKSIPRKLTTIEPSLEGDSTSNQQDNEVVGDTPSEGLSTSHPVSITRCGPFANGLEVRELVNSTAGPDSSLAEISVSGVTGTGSKTQNDVLHTIEQQAKRAPIGNERDAFSPMVHKSLREKSPLPFEKCSSMWDSIESMEVFSAMPQQPHFCPLDQYCRELREGMAIGLMITFSNLVENICKLQITNSCYQFHEKLKALVELEAHGFDVERVRARIVELLRMKDNLKQVRVKRSELEVTLAEKLKEKNQLNTQIESVGKLVTELEKSISNIQELRITKKRSENNYEVAKLEADSRTVESALLSVKHDFESILSADWHTL